MGTFARNRLKKGFIQKLFTIKTLKVTSVTLTNYDNKSPPN